MIKIQHVVLPQTDHAVSFLACVRACVCVRVCVSVDGGARASGQARLRKEHEEKERKRKEKAEAHLFTIIKVRWTVQESLSHEINNLAQDEIVRALRQHFRLLYFHQGLTNLCSRVTMPSPLIGCAL